MVYQEVSLYSAGAIPVRGGPKRILKGIEEINAAPVVFRWNPFDLGLE